MRWIWLLVAAQGAAVADPYAFADAQSFLKTYCAACHTGKAAVAGFDLAKYPDAASMMAASRRWTAAVNRVREHEMPPKSAKQPGLDERERFAAFFDREIRAAACADGIQAPAAPMRRLNRNEYAATLRDLLNIHVNAAAALPADGAGGEGFDNAAETLFLSPVHAEKYLEAARTALDYGIKDPESLTRFVTDPGEGVAPEEAARKTIAAFVPRAFRRPARDGEVERYLALYRGAAARKESYEDSIRYALEAILVSPQFLFRLEPPNLTGAPRALDGYSYASRLSYFLWGSMPDEELFLLASEGKLSDPLVRRAQIERMLNDQKSRDFAESFVEQWLGTRELGRDIKPDAKLFPQYYDKEISGGMRYEPIIYFQEILARNLSLLRFIDSKYTVVTKPLARHYGFDLKDPALRGLREQPLLMDLPAGSHRGGVLTMAAVLAVSSYPHRTSPVLRGKWILDNFLGTPPPPPPPNVPKLDEAHEGAAPATVRERLARHRENPACAGCHARIDPLGFGLENYDVLGRWITEQAGRPIDARGELPDGTRFDGAAQLKAVLMERRDVFVTNLTAKMLGYALGRGLTLEDQCAVEAIVAKLKANDYPARLLIEEIVSSVPFTMQAASNVPAAVSRK